MIYLKSSMADLVYIDGMVNDIVYLYVGVWRMVHIRYEFIGDTADVLFQQLITFSSFFGEQ